jgi:hypothetical protein
MKRKLEYAAFLIAVFAVCTSVVWVIHLLGYIDSESFLMIVFMSIAFAFGIYLGSVHFI